VSLRRTVPPRHPRFLLVRTLLLALFALTSAAAEAQDRLATPLDQEDATLRQIVELDSLYRSAVHSDPEQAVFAGREGDVVQAWGVFLQSLGAFMRAEGMEWSEPIRGYHRFYFAPDGSVDRVLYALRDEDGPHTARYGEVLDAFVRTHRIELTAEEPFAQCSSVTIRPPAE
jgi:hypothetical protein